jgi:undecaprenyl-diphosphatase
VLVLFASLAGARHDHIHPLEQRVFHAVNGLPGFLFPVLWVPMQLGNLVVGTAVGVLVAWAMGELQLVLGVVVAAALKLASERWLRRQMADYLEVRQRPGTSQTGAVLRGDDVPASGPSFPSGHVVLVAAVGAVVWTGLPGAIAWVPWALALLVAVGRVYVGAHNPLDVTAGLGMGMAVGGVIDLLLR